MPEIVASLIFLAPASAAVIIALGIMTGQLRGEQSENMISTLSSLAMLLSFAILVCLLIYSIWQPGSLTGFALLDWFSSGELSITIAMSTDRLALGIGSLFALLLLITLRFSVNYLHREDGFQRFFLIFNLFSCAMLLIVLSGNAITAFLGWELAGLSSYLLIAYAYDRPMATRNASRVFITNRLGDAGFILALVLAFYWVGNSEWSELNRRWVSLDALQRGLIVGGFALAAMVKSAQFPFSAWLGRSLEGPTPSSAVFYGSVMVHAGIFLLLRVAPAIELTASLQVVLIVCGILTVLYGWLGGFVQTDVKTALIFSTHSQTGLMLIFIGLGWYTVATIHLVAHAIWRAYQMLSAPSYLTLISRPARAAPGWLRRHPRLFNAVLQRFWLDHIIDWLAVYPTNLLARDLNTFDERVVNRMVGLPSQLNAISSLTEWEQRKRGLINAEAAVAKGHGVFGALMERIAMFLHWFEESLVLKGSGDGLIRVLRQTGYYLIRIEYLLSRPRYLWLMITLTLLVMF